jgi:hypothetical protein
MSPRSSPAPSSEFASAIRKVSVVALGVLASAIASGAAAPAADPADDAIKLQLSPRVCTLSAHDENCDTAVTAQWHASRDESLCLLIVGQPQIKQCWENHSQGVYTVRLVFDHDLVVELRDVELQQVLASEAIAVIKEALRLRRKRRQPWDILS